MSETANVSVLTAKKIKSPKWVLLASCILAAAADVFVLAVLGVGGFAGKYFVCPAILLGLDLLFIAGIVLSNFRYRYSVLQVVLYLVGAALLICLTVLIDMGTGKTAWITRMAAICWIVLHVLVCLSVLVAALYAAKLKRVFKSGAAVCICALLAIASVLYAIFVSANGFFGQGIGGGVRTLVYTYLEDEDAYEVSGVLSGKGDTVVVPETFNGKEVVSFDCAVFTAKGVRSVSFDCGPEVEFVNLSALSSLTDNVSVYIHKDSTDAMKEVFYHLTEENSAVEDALFTLAGNTFPNGLSENEVFVSFGYDSRAYEIADGKVLPTWFGVKGEVFDAEAYLDDFPYLGHTDTTSGEDLHWNYQNMDGYIVRAFEDGKGSPILGQKINESVGNVSVRFEKIYTVSLGTDNDSLYETDESYGQTVLPDKTLPYRYTVKSHADSLLEIPERAGFTLSWEYAQGAGEKTPLEQLSAVLDENVTAVTIYPEWSLDAPEVTLSSDKGNSVVYGEEVCLQAEADSLAEGISFKYEWSALGGQPESGEEKYSLAKPEPSESGLYAVKVTAYSDTATSLTSTGEAVLTLSIAKKPVTFTWDIPEGAEAIYSGTDKPVTCTLDEGQEVEDDIIGYTLSETSVRAAGSYLIQVILTGDAAEKYVAASGNGERSVVITPYEVTLQWNGDSYIYDGTAHVPSASASGVGEDEDVSLTVRGEGTDAGQYVATAVIEDSNYTAKNISHSFTVEKRKISVSAWEEKLLTYNGRLQLVRAVSVENEVEGEEDLILEEYIRYSVTTGGVNAGTHTVKAALADNCNYTFESVQSCEYEIAKATVSLTWAVERTFVYDGTVKRVTAIGVSGAIYGEEGAVLSSLSYTGESSQAGQHTMRAELPGSSNYVLSAAECSYTIEKRNLTVRFNKITKTYDGQTAEFTYTTEGLASGDTLDEVLSLTYGGTAPGAKDVGTYEIDATFAENEKGSNYNVQIVSAQLTIGKKTISVEWSPERSFVYNGKEQYVRVSAVVGAVEGEESAIISSLVYAGKGINIGNYTASVTLPSGSNYVFAAVQSCSYTITAKKVGLSWKDDVFVFTYDGGGKAPEAVCDEPAVSVVYEYFTSDGISLGNVKPTKVGDYTVTVKIDEKNYTAESIVHEFSIVDGSAVGEA